MKLLPEVPTKELLDAIAYGQPISASHDDIYRAMYAAAPEVKDEPVAWTSEEELKRGKRKKQSIVAWTEDYDDYPVALYLQPSQRIAELEQEVARLREQLATARRDALEEAANVHVDIALITDSDYYYRGFNDCQEKFRKAIRALKEKA